MSKSSKTILMIDDSVAIHRLVEAHLSDEFPRTHLASSGAYGLEMAAKLKPDLILLDLDLPDMNGFDVCRFLKADAATASIPVIFLSASDSIDAQVCGLDLLAVDYIVKPFQPAELSARVRAALRDRHPHSAPAAVLTPDSSEGNEYWEFG